jgi:8-oxo-dGTP pyrophosphatase MutT (NUDIX family)
MWTGGVRVVIPDDRERILMLRQRHEDRDIWMIPGGGIEDEENAAEAAVREVREETGLEIRVGPLLWHVEEVSPERGQRFVNIFLGAVCGGRAVLGSDPELDGARQVLRELRFLSQREIQDLACVYPAWLYGELWPVLRADPGHAVFRIRAE